MNEGAYLTAEARARVEIDRQLAACGWMVQDRSAMNLYASQGVAVREFIMATGHRRADYILLVDQKAVGAIEAKPSGTPLAGVEPQSAKYSTGLPKDLPALVNPLPSPAGCASGATTPTAGRCGRGCCVLALSRLTSIGHDVCVVLVGWLRWVVFWVGWLLAGVWAR